MIIRAIKNKAKTKPKEVLTTRSSNLLESLAVQTKLQPNLKSLSRKNKIEGRVNDLPGSSLELKPSTIVFVSLLHTNHYHGSSIATPKVHSKVNNYAVTWDTRSLSLEDKNIYFLYDRVAP